MDGRREGGRNVGVTQTIARFVGLVALAGRQVHCPRIVRFVRSNFSLRVHHTRAYIIRAVEEEVDGTEGGKRDDNKEKERERRGGGRPLGKHGRARPFVMERRNCFRGFSTWDSAFSTGAGTSAGIRNPLGARNDRNGRSISRLHPGPRQFRYLAWVGALLIYKFAPLCRFHDLVLVVRHGNGYPNYLRFII